MKKCLHTARENLLLIVLILQPFLDVLAYIQRDYPISAAGYIRLALTVCMPVYALLITKRKKALLGSVGIIAVFSLLHLLNSLRGGMSGVFADTKYMLQVIHMPVLFFSFLFLYEKDALKKQVTAAFIVNAITSVLLFYLSYFLQSGEYTYSLFPAGWTGWYVIANAQSSILVCLLPLAVYFSVKYFKYYFPLICLPLIYMYIMNGTKATALALFAVFVAVAVFVLAELVFVKRDRFRIFTASMAVVLLATSILCYHYCSPRHIINTRTEADRQQEQNYIDEVIDSNGDSDDPSDKPIKDVYVQFINPNLIDRFGAERVLEAYGDHLNSYDLADMRLKKRVYGQLAWEDCDFADKLVGLNFTTMQHNGDNFDLENDPQAILYYYGYIGAALLLLFLGYYILRILKQLITHFKDTFTLFNFILLLTFALQIFGAVYSGYYFRRPNVSIYMTAVLLLVHCQTEPLFKKNKA